MSSAWSCSSSWLSFCSGSSRHPGAPHNARAHQTTLALCCLCCVTRQGQAEMVGRCATDTRVADVVTTQVTRPCHQAKGNPGRGPCLGFRYLGHGPHRASRCVNLKSTPRHVPKRQDACRARGTERPAPVLTETRAVAGTAARISPLTPRCPALWQGAAGGARTGPHPLCRGADRRNTAATRNRNTAVCHDRIAAWHRRKGHGEAGSGSGETRADRRPR